MVFRQLMRALSSFCAQPGSDDGFLSLVHLVGEAPPDARCFKHPQVFFGGLPVVPIAFGRLYRMLRQRIFMRTSQSLLLFRQKQFPVFWCWFSLVVLISISVLR